MRPEKKAIVDELRSQVSNALFVILADYHGLNVAQANDLRLRLEKADADFRVVKNRLFRHVVRDLHCEGLESGLRGPSAMILGRGDVVEAAKVLRAFIKEHELPVVKVGAMEGSLLSAADVSQLAELPPRQALLGLFVSTLAAPLQQVAGVLYQKAASLLYVLRAVEEKKQKSSS